MGGDRGDLYICFCGSLPYGGAVFRAELAARLRVGDVAPIQFHAVKTQLRGSRENS